jgi:Bifunctional DNA primase/polymerase, N-terminal
MSDSDQAAHAAIALALGDGYACFPAALNKRPTTPHGFLDATSGLLQLQHLFRRFPGPLVGVRTGAASGIDVLDLDAKYPEAKAWLQQHRARLWDTRAHRSRSGGLHFIFEHADGLRCSNGRLARGVEVKADGGCITWWPAAGFPVLCTAPPAPWPPWLLAQLRRPPPPSRPAHWSSPTRIDFRLERIVQRVARAREPERNRITFWAGCRIAELTAGGLLQQASAAEAVIAAAMHAGLSRLEAASAVRSGLRTGTRR